MTIPYGFASMILILRVARSLLPCISLLLLPGAVLAAQPDPPEQEQSSEQQQANEPLPTTPPPDTHANRQAPIELMIKAAGQPEAFIGKTLILHDGMNSKTVGPVINVRKRLQDEELYLIVDATAYFNTATEYAVAVRDLDRIEGDKLVIPEGPGMHLHGLDYYPADYADIEVETTVLPVEEDAD
jgi:hypothetical protein